MVLIDKLRRPSALASAALLLVASVVPVLIHRDQAQAALVTTRSITMSSSADGTLTAGQNVTYDVQFDLGSNQTTGSIAVQFCSNSPIIGDSCTAPTGFDVDAATEATGGSNDLSGFTKDATETVVNRFVAAVDTPAADVIGDTVHITLSGVDNPDGANGTFYARVFTYATSDGTGASTDAGGIALSTAAQITVTSKVQERLVFCVYTTGAGNDCTGKSGTAIALGDTNGVLDPAGPYVDKNAKFSITTNASGNAVVRVKGATLTTGAYTIDAIGGTPATSALGTEQFGLCVYESAGSGLTEDAVYDGGAGAECAGTTQSAGTGTVGGNGTADFAFDTASTTSTYGDAIATKAAGAYSTGTLATIGNISNTTEAGIYTTTLTFIATGTY